MHIESYGHQEVIPRQPVESKVTLWRYAPQAKSVAWTAISAKMTKRALGVRRFVCQMALADPAGEVRAQSEGACRGRILFQPRGSQGFGYDPLFEIVEYHRTFAELGIAVKSCLSHRARAARAFIPTLTALVDS